MAENEGAGGAAGQGGRRMGIGEGLRTGIGVLSALREAVEETVQEAMQRGDLSPDRAREVVETAFRRAQDAMGDVRDRLDVVPRREFDELRAAVAALSRRVDELEGRPPADSDHLLPAAGETTVGRGPADDASSATGDSSAGDESPLVHGNAGSGGSGATSSGGTSSAGGGDSTSGHRTGNG